MLKLIDIDFKTFKKEIYPYYLELFPKDERKSLKQIEVPYLNGISKLISIKDNDKTVGFLIYNTLDGNKYVQLDYFAIFKEFQNKKYGTEAIKILKEFLKDYNGVYGEVEKAGLGQDEEENKKRDRRIKFWENLGFQLFDFDLELFGVIYSPCILMIKDVDVDYDEIMKCAFEIYVSLLGEDKVNKKCRIIKDS